MDVSEEEEEEVRRIRELEKDEPLLQENPRRFVMFPIQYSDIWKFYKKAVGKYSWRQMFHFRGKKARIMNVL